jgi:hypothetical protein
MLRLELTRRGKKVDPTSLQVRACLRHLVRSATLRPRAPKPAQVRILLQAGWCPAELQFNHEVANLHGTGRQSVEAEDPAALCIGLHSF